MHNLPALYNALNLDDNLNLAALAGTSSLLLGAALCGGAITLAMTLEPVIVSISSTGIITAVGGHIGIDIMMALSTAALLVGVTLVSPKIEAKINERDTNRYPLTFPGLALHCGMVALYSLSLSLLTNFARNQIGANCAASLGIWGSLGVQALFITTCVGIFHIISGMYDYHSKKSEYQDGITLIPVKHVLSWLITSTLCTVAASATPLLSCIMTTGAISAADTLAVCLFISIDYAVNGALKKCIDIHLATINTPTPPVV